MTEHEALLCLNAVSGLGSLKIQRLLLTFKSPLLIWRQKKKDLYQVEGVGRQAAENILGFDRSSFLKQEDRLMRMHKVKVVAFFDDSYPDYLKQIDAFPVVLYTAGQWDGMTFPGLAIVGSRRASVYGLSIAKYFGNQFARAGITVISGMARGIDTAVHQGCLESRGKTAAVLGSGLANVYPQENRRLFNQITESGSVISEFPMETGPLAGNFPRRNRIISGLSLGVVVVEAAVRSGALITSRYALDQGRDVFAVPGKVGQPQASGVNRLIQQGAKLVTCVDDILEEFPDFKFLPDLNQGAVNDSLSDLPQSEQGLLKLLSDEPMHVDDIVTQTQMGYQILTGILLKFECCGRIKRLPGNYFVKNI